MGSLWTARAQGQVPSLSQPHAVIQVAQRAPSQNRHQSPERTAHATRRNDDVRPDLQGLVCLVAGGFADGDRIAREQGRERSNLQVEHSTHAIALHLVDRQGGRRSAPCLLGGIGKRNEGVRVVKRFAEATRFRAAFVVASLRCRALGRPGWRGASRSAVPSRARCVAGPTPMRIAALGCGACDRCCSAGPLGFPLFVESPQLVHLQPQGSSLGELPPRTVEDVRLRPLGRAVVDGRLELN